MNNKLNLFENENFLLESITREQKNDSFVPMIIAIDEVGRGCVAGPVLSCASVWAPKTSCENNLIKNKSWLLLIDDSKKLSEKKRAQCFDLILEDYELNLSNIPYSNFNPITPNELIASKTKLHFKFDLFLNKINKEKSKDFECIYFSLGEASSIEVDNFNIWNAVQLAAGRALKNLFTQIENKVPKFKTNLNKSIILMDGKHFIKVPKEFVNNIQATVTQADGLFISVGFSSILAKVYRDTFMINQDSIYPSFGFSGHKGYGTPKHLSVIQNKGICPLHRKSFLTNYYSD